MMRSNSFYLTQLKQQTLMHKGVGCVIITFFFSPHGTIDVMEVL